MAKTQFKPPARAHARFGRSESLSLGLIVAACLALLVALNPYGGLAQPTDFPLVCFGVAGLCAALLLPGADSFAVLARWRVAWAICALALWAVTCALVSGRLPGATFGANGSALGWPVIALGAVVVLGSAFHARRLRKLLVWAGVAVVTVEFGMTMFEAYRGSVPGGTLSNSSNTGLVLCLLTPLVFWSGLRAEGLWPRVWRLAVAAAGVATLLVGDARTSTVALAVALLVWGVGELARRYGRRVRVALVTALGAASIVGMGFIALRWSVLSQGALGVFYRQRTGLWQPALWAIERRPVFGWGPDGYQFAVGRVGVRGAYVAWQVWPPGVDPHNLVLWFGVSTGVVGIALAAWIAFEAVRSWRLQSQTTAEIPVGPIAAGVALYAVSALTTPAALQTLPIALIILGASLRPVATPAPQVSRGVARAVRWSAVVLAVLVGAYGLTRLTVANRLSPPGPVAAQRAADLWRVDPFLYYNASLRWGYAAQDSPDVVGKQLDLIAIRRAVSLDPANWLYQLELARTLVSYGLPGPDIEAAFKRALELGPASPEARAAYAQYLVAIGQLGGAKTLLDQTTGLAPSTEAARVFALYYRAIGNEAQAKRYDQIQRTVASALVGPNGGYR